MSRIDLKSIGTLIDELITTNIKCFMAQEKLMITDDDTTAANAARSAQRLNARRGDLIRAIDECLGDEDITQTEKTYG